MRPHVEGAVLPLIGKALWACGRAADMATFAFGQRKKIPDRRGGLREVGEYALHVQCPWRITRDELFVVGSRDLYYPADYHDIHEEVPSEFDWNRAPSRRDKLLTSLFENGSREFVVQGIEVRAAGFLHIVLADGLYLDVLPDDSLDHEHWRLFRPGADEPHFVVTGRGIET